MDITMTDEVQALEDAPEVVETEVDTEASEATETTEGQVDDQPAEGEQPEDDAEKISKSKERRERRKAELAKAKAEAEEARIEAERYRREVERLKSRQMQPPKQEDFQDYDDFIAAKTAYRAVEMMGKDRLEEAEREAQERQQRAQQAAQRQMEQARQNWAAQAEEARTRYADFDTVVNAPDLPVSEGMAQYIALSDAGADLAYHLGMNRAQAREIAAMHPQAQVGALRMLEQFVSVNRPRPRTQSKAPEPITPVKPKATAAKRPEDMTIEEYDAWRRKGGTFKL